MNENIDLTKILKDCPKGWNLYSTVLGPVKFEKITDDKKYPVNVIICKDGRGETHTANGKFIIDEGECTLLPSREQRDWSKFTAPWYKKDKFDPKTLKAFDKVLVRKCVTAYWRCDHFSFIQEEFEPHYEASSYSYAYCIPYNDETKHLVGTNDEAPEYYRYWED